MTDSLRGRCELFVGNQRILKKAFRFETTHMLSLCSFLGANEKAISDPSRIRACRKEIRSKNGMWSNFGSFSLLALASLNSLDPDKAQTLDKAIEIYKKLCRKVHSSSYVSIASYLLSKLSESDTDTSVARTISALELIKKLFPRQRLGDDIVYAAIFSISERTEEDLTKSLEECALYLSSSVSKQSLKLLSVACAINGSDPSSCAQRFISLRDEIEKRGIRIHKNDRYTLLHVFTLSCIKVPQNELADLLFEVYTYFKEQNCFGRLFGKAQKLVYSILNLYGEYVPENEKKSDPEVKAEVKGSSLSVATSVSAVICAEISRALAANSVI